MEGRTKGTFFPCYGKQRPCGPEWFFAVGWLGGLHRPVNKGKAEGILLQAEGAFPGYKRLVNVARSEGNERLSLLLQTVCSTGIRISELNYITVNAVDKQIAEVDCKGKVRTVFLTDGLCRLLKAYARKMNIVSGMIFVTRNGRPLDRSNIWREMKRISHKAGVNPDKVFPHNLRHLFARVYYSQEKDLVRLADILGHSSVNTTRIYTMESGENHLRQLEKMDLLIDRYNRIPLLL